MPRGWSWPIIGRSAGVERGMVNLEKEEAILMKQGSQAGTTRVWEQDDSVIIYVPAAHKSQISIRNRRKGRV
jgi:hypothetical protein